MINKTSDYNNEDNKDKKHKRKEVLIYGGAGLLLPLLILYFLLSIYYNKHFYNNTMINGVNASNMTVKQVEIAINKQVNSYILTLEERNNKSEQIYGGDFELYAVFDGMLGELLNEQDGFAWPVYLIKSRELEVNTMIEYDESLLKERFNQLICLTKENTIKPVNAHISQYGENGYEIVPEEQGAKVKKDKLYEKIKEAVFQLEPVLSLDKEGCYEEPKVDSKNPKLLKALEDMNKLVSAKITYEFGEDTEVVDGKRISEWISIDKKYVVHLNKDGVKEFVDHIGKNYNSFGRVRTFKTSYGETIKVSGGDYGWWLNRGQEANELTELILAGKQEVKEPAYFQTASQYGEDDIGDTYVEINLTAQHLFFYKEGKRILETDFVSGNISRNYGTPTGTYPIQYKENDATLNGEDYSTPVKYWMPFNGNIGLHDAPWRNEFGKDIYLTKGSHGCINMPPDAAKKMFKNIKRGVAVVVYELQGTENYEKKDNKRLDSIRED
ncbi:putative peptidoglycan binding protein [Mobilisporobacter senegalensis]|uniref:Putative peptidoglycan binding protein n=1 Tax=Mobilisporobacter senegalensis TaxID=1329262 RepID=A0A3N1XHZ3_9FIRM|nr:L,D-transpeptidase family protein [Mobilisporobacter senegalensis]ROR26360.1 putative peptidoglycan binding protein [Mobilisporobacter senegalensis]